MTTDRVARERAAAMDLMREIGQGKVEVLPRFRVRSLDDVAALYTPGVGYLVQEVLARPEALGELTGRDMSDIAWYFALGCFKLGCILEGTYARAVAGQAPMETGERLIVKTFVNDPSPSLPTVTRRNSVSSSLP